MIIRIEGARVILPTDVVQTDISVADGVIETIGEKTSADHVIDGRGRVLAPAMVDIHGDAFERQVMPRSGVFFPLDAALLDTDRQLAANGIATAYHALTLSWEPGLRSAAQGSEIIDRLSALTPRLSVENRVQIRWETFAFEAVDVIARALSGPLTPSLAFNDHTSMVLTDFDVTEQERPFEHSDSFVPADLTDPRMARRLAPKLRRSGLSSEDYTALLADIWTRRPQVQAVMARVAQLARDAGASMLSHDDTQIETRDFYRNLGARISEFPMTQTVAEAARAAGDKIVFGAPNVVRGGSHIGSPNAADMVEAGLCDALASDYFYPAMLAAIARLHADARAPLHRLWPLVSAGPAAASGLTDRGQIAVGQRADLILLDWPDKATPAVKMTMAAGRIAYGTDILPG